MGDGMPQPKKRSTYDTIKNRGRDIDEQVDAATNPKEVAPPKAPEPKGMPKPSLLDRVKRMVGM